MPTSQPDQAFLDDFATLSTFGATPGKGVDRQAATAADGEQRHWFANWLEQRGFTVRYDKIGNQFGLLEVVPGAPYVLVGSHLDSQPLGGRFDGAYGVLAGAHAAWRLKQRWQAGAAAPKHNLAVVNWFNEEGCRFRPSLMGSGVLTGKFDLEATLAITDEAGITVAQALADIGTIDPDGEAPAAAAYAEIHIEQGPELERDGLAIGVVDATWAAKKFELVVRGEQSHTGSTPMEFRHDALLGAALVIAAVRDQADQHADVPLHACVSYLTLEPNSPVTTAREVRLHVDSRCADERVLEQAKADLFASFREIEERARVKIEQVAAHEWGNLAYQSEGVKLALDVADQLHLPRRTIMTVAGHDSTNMKDLVPTVMLFVPSVGGVSHNEREHTEDHDLLAGLGVLTEVVGRLAAGELD
ncbi:amidase, hydantoinase/carbamoylase family [Segniliparus rotundus DSM 44985]|uniref:Amidase, hydantoinase/carbamoylase family n=1 Tax=Segniliparus rotundus (strain ATCC BAA-972 / CDC 1076 / CIP 108378 / DSM 44985 / JCM 13578) TaxID=640132 RepID=D6ZDT5_SEGRD|nr:M20 family metallo-hydrolase [Segniliparus rotundus]ADG99342.1 amidase, hydantoinase/carbamoylase family [Segniliparus rotundus DSM 44985]